MYDYHMVGSQYVQERTWYPEMEDARQRIENYKKKNCKGDLSSNVQAIKEEEKKLTMRKFGSPKHDSVGLMSLGVNSVYELQAMSTASDSTRPTSTIASQLSNF